MFDAVIKSVCGPSQKLPTQKARIMYLTNISLLPCLICFLAFSRSFLYRYIITAPDTLQGVDIHCEKYGWLNNASIRMTCENRPLDIHATLALSWLLLYTVQALLMKFGLRKLHMAVGKLLGVIAFVNVIGMLQLSTMDIINPMVTERPPIFTPFMFGTAIIMSWCLYESYNGLWSTPRDMDRHALWITRCFLMSFTTPVIRFYPLVLRYVFSTACIKKQLALDTWVIGSMTVSCVLTLWFFYLVNKACLDKPYDIFLKGFMAFTAVAFVIDFIQTFWLGTFIGHMYQCWKDGDAGPTIFDAIPFHPLVNLFFIVVIFFASFVLLVGSGDESEEESDEVAGEGSRLLS